MIPPDAGICDILIGLASSEVRLFDSPDTPSRRELQRALATAFAHVRAAWQPVRRELRDAEHRRQREHAGAALGRLAPSN